MAILSRDGLRFDNLTGAQKGAVLFMVLGTEASAKVMQSLTSDEQESVSRAIAVTPMVEPNLVESVISEFRQVAMAVESISRGGVEYARGVLDKAVGAKRATEIIDKIQEQRVELGLKGLKKVAPELLFSVLHGEHPQTIALILAHLDVRQSAAVLETMDGELSGDVLYRMGRMEKVAPEMLQVVERGLSSKADLSLSQDLTLSGGPQAVANVLNHTGGTVEKSLIESIAQRDEDLAALIRSYMFVFEDLKLLDQRSMQRALRDVDGKELALALKAATEELKQHIVGSLSERAGAALLEEFEFMGPVRVRDVEAAQANIIQTIRTLEEAGEIVFAGRGGQDDIIQ